MEQGEIVKAESCGARSQSHGGLGLHLIFHEPCFYIFSVKVKSSLKTCLLGEILNCGIFPIRGHYNKGIKRNLAMYSASKTTMTMNMQEIEDELTY